MKNILLLKYYGSFNGKARHYIHDITRIIPRLEIQIGLWKKIKLKYKIIKDFNLDEYSNLSLKDIIDYEAESQNNNSHNLEINDLNYNIDIDIENELINVYENKDRIEKDNKKKNIF